MKTKTAYIWIGVLTLLAVGISLAAVSYLPEQVVSHWNAQGQADGSMSRGWGLALLPLTIIGVSLLLMAIPAIDPLKENIAQFRTVYNALVVMLGAYFLYIHLLVVLWNLGLRFEMNTALLPAVGLLFYAMGLFLKRSRRNWFMGVRTPWTLSSDSVWEKTHQRASWVFRGLGIAFLVLLFLPQMFLWILLGGLFMAVIYLTVYSYMLFRQEKDSAAPR